MSDLIHSEQTVALDTKSPVTDDNACLERTGSAVPQQNQCKLDESKHQPISNSLAYFFDPKTKVVKFF